MRFRSWKQEPYVSGILVGINVLVFLLCTFTGQTIYQFGRIDVWDVIVQGEYGRILWAMFLHIDIQHLFNNMLLLFFLGSMLEKAVGHWRYALVFFLSGIGGNVISLLVKQARADISGSVGASGAVFGLDGLLLALVLFSPWLLQNVTKNRVILMIILSLYSGFAGRNIDNAAHIGGLLTGFLVGTMVCLPKRRNKNKA